jgi:hypothetical protein
MSRGIAESDVGKVGAVGAVGGVGTTSSRVLAIIRNWPHLAI